MVQDSYYKYFLARQFPSSVAAPRTILQTSRFETACRSQNTRRHNRSHVVLHSSWEPSTADAAADVEIIPYLTDNYCYAVKDRFSGEAVLIDPGIGPEIIPQLQSRGFFVGNTFTTHNHEDHTAGNEDIAAAYPEIGILSTQYEVNPARNARIEPGTVFHITERTRLRALPMRCHTKASQGYFIYDDEDPTRAPLLFTGDALYCAGAGPFVEGHVKAFAEVRDRLKTLPPETLVFPGHDFTEPNLRFALQVEPENPDIRSRLQTVRRLMAEGKPTVPSTLEMEFLTNPFLRAPTLKRLQIIRDAKDVFDRQEGIYHI
eukprot:Selendium_serpulae@DN5024_c0_g1_i1.p1